MRSGRGTGEAAAVASPGRLADAAGDVDPEVDDPAVSMAVATALYLAHRRDMLEGDDEEILRLAARAEWRGDPPALVAEWLAERGARVCG